MAHAEVRRYYENNTRRMLRWGPGRSEGVLHRGWVRYRFLVFRRGAA
jgi:hypothetical protein